MQARVTENNKNFGSCGCGRSPTGKCCGWHGLTEEVYRERLAQYKAAQLKKANHPEYMPPGAGAGGQ
jgi:hypothetical protein